VSAELGNTLVRMRFDAERGLAAQAADVPGARLARLLHVVGITETVGLVTHCRRIIERLPEDPCRRNVLFRCQVLVAEDQNLVCEEVLAQPLGRRIIDIAGEIDAEDLGPESWSRPAHLVCAHSCHRRALRMSSRRGAVAQAP
jgi:hypothetical protein